MHINLMPYKEMLYSNMIFKVFTVVSICIVVFPVMILKSLQMITTFQTNLLPQIQSMGLHNDNSEHHNLKKHPRFLKVKYVLAVKLYDTCSTIIYLKQFFLFLNNTFLNILLLDKLGKNYLLLHRDNKCTNNEVAHRDQVQAMFTLSWIIQNFHVLI